MEKANDYDQWAAERQKRLISGENLPHAYVEKPAMRNLLPNLKGKRVLLLGCGTGEESQLLAEFGASDMTGIDLSKESIRLASQTYPDIRFEVGDMHRLDFQAESFDFIYSSLTIHYSDKPKEVYQELHRVLRPGGSLQFSVGHPMRWASERLEIEGVSSKIMGYSEDVKHPRLYGTYSTFAQHEETFFAKAGGTTQSGEVLSFWVGPPSMHFGLLREAGFNVESFVESQTIEACKDVDAYYYERNHEFPQFCIFSARKL
jgi:ubiquinone/menaquinone biosynthesis C-methylase UbiE